MYKMVICDLDGTLLNSSLKIFDETIKVINKLKNRGIKFVIATGRLDIMIKEYTDYLGNDFDIICCNGAVIKNLKLQNIIYKKTLEYSKCEKVFEICKKNGLSYYLFCEGALLGDDPTNGRIQYLSKYNETLQEKHKINIVLTDNLIKDMRDKDIYKIVISNTDTNLLENVAKEVMECIDVIALRSASNILDVFENGVSKGEAMLNLAKNYSIDKSEIISFGDNQNDLDMIEKAGLGIAMGNAEKNIKNLADAITLTNDENGVCFKLKEIFGI